MNRRTFVAAGSGGFFGGLLGGSISKKKQEKENVLEEKKTFAEWMNEDLSHPQIMGDIHPESFIGRSGIIEPSTFVAGSGSLADLYDHNLISQETLVRFTINE